MRQHELEDDIEYHARCLTHLSIELHELDKSAVVAYYKSYTGMIPSDDWSKSWQDLPREEKDVWRTQSNK